MYSNSQGLQRPLSWEMLWMQLDGSVLQPISGGGQQCPTALSPQGGLLQLVVYDVYHSQRQERRARGEWGQHHSLERVPSHPLGQQASSWRLRFLSARDAVQMEYHGGKYDKFSVVDKG